MGFTDFASDAGLTGMPSANIEQIALSISVLLIGRPFFFDLVANTYLASRSYIVG
jgi:hypothetical protein